MSRTVMQDTNGHARSNGAGARDRAQSRVRYATSGIPSRLLGEHWGVSAQRARHRRSGTKPTELAQLLAMIADPRVPDDSAAALVAAVLESYEERHAFAPYEVLGARLAHLREVEEHRLEAEQNRALMVATIPNAPACRQHAAALIEIAMLETLLNGEE